MVSIALCHVAIATPIHMYLLCVCVLLSVGFFLASSQWSVHLYWKTNTTLLQAFIWILIGFVHTSLGMFRTEQVFTIKQICTDEQPMKCADTLLVQIPYSHDLVFNDTVEPPLTDTSQ